MTSKLEQDVRAAVEAATRAGAGGRMDDFIGRLADKVGAHANVKAVFGEPIERDGLIVVPVAKVRWGFGGAGGGPMLLPMARTPRAREAGEAAGEPRIDGGDPTSESGQGGGGAVTADPIGWLEIGEDGAEFRPIVAAMPSPAFMVATTLGAAMILRALARLLRR
jgi:uncharacterized spore protein YtfJ